MEGDKQGSNYLCLIFWLPSIGAAFSCYNTVERQGQQIGVGCGLGSKVLRARGAVTDANGSGPCDSMKVPKVCQSNSLQGAGKTHAFPYLVGKIISAYEREH